MSRCLKLSTGQSSDKGQRKLFNADAVGSFLPPDPRWRAVKGTLFALADGVDGWQSGYLAAQSAIRYLIYAYYADPSLQPTQALVRAIQATNAWLYAWASRYPAHRDLRTTLVAAVVWENQAVVANVGDSRAYLIRSGYPYRITRDHRWVAEAMAAGGLTPEQAQRHPWRNVLSRAIGVRPEVAVDIFPVALQPGDVLVLCSDGLWERVRGQEMGSLVRAYPPAEAARRLVALARMRGEPDDITALIVRWEAPRPAAVAYAPYPVYRPPAYAPAYVTASRPALTAAAMPASDQDHSHSDRIFAVFLVLLAFYYAVTVVSLALFRGQ